MTAYPIQYDLANVFTFREKGSGNIDWTIAPRNADGQLFRYLPLWLRCHFPSSGSVEAAQNAFEFKLDHWAGQEYDCTLFADLNVGVTSFGQRDLFWRWPMEEWSAWVIEPKSVLKITWTNPEATVQTWGVEVGILRL